MWQTGIEGAGQGSGGEGTGRTGGAARIGEGMMVEVGDGTIAMPPEEGVTEESKKADRERERGLTSYPGGRWLPATAPRSSGRGKGPPVGGGGE